MDAFVPKLSTAQRSRHAVVLGASMAGLVTAAALSKLFDRVTVLERDELPDHPVARRGVPQSRHLHALLPRGLHAIESLLPGYEQRLVEAGGARGELVRDAEWIMNGKPLARCEGELWGVAASRPLTEAVVRRDVRAMDNVQLIGNARAEALLARGLRVHGVRAQLGDARPTELAADLVVDCRGRAANVEEWLAELGATVPERTEVHVDVGYWSARYRVPEGELGSRNALIVGADPSCPRGGGAMKIENGDVMLLLAAYAHEGRAPRDHDEMLAFAATLRSPALLEILRAGAPLDPVSQYRVRANVRRRFERARVHAEGYIVLGDAHTAFNPIYGQGMTVAALEALELRAALEQGSGRLAQRFYRRAAKPVDIAWQLATSSDLRMPTVEGKRHWYDSWLARWVDRITDAAAIDPVLTRTFMGVTSLIDPPWQLLAPSTIRRVLAAERGRVEPAAPHEAPIGATP